MTDPILNTWIFLDRYSKRIWDKIKIARRKEMRISETTITEDLIFDLAFDRQNKNFRIAIFESALEKVNGNDLEVFVETDEGYVMIPCQAKIVDKAGKYQHIRHRNGTDYQIDLLLKYAKRHQDVAGYIFYNYLPYSSKRNLDTLRKLREHHEDESVFGITWSKAELVKGKFFANESKKGLLRQKVPHFNDIHPSEALPFADLIFNLLKGGEKIGDNPFYKDLLVGVKFYTRNEIQKSGHWRKPASGGFFLDTSRMMTEFTLASMAEFEEFRPAYRVIISREHRMLTAFNIARSSHKSKNRVP